MKMKAQNLHLEENSDKIDGKTGADSVKSGAKTGGPLGKKNAATDRSFVRVFKTLRTPESDVWPKENIGKTGDKIAVKLDRTAVAIDKSFVKKDVVIAKISVKVVAKTEEKQLVIDVKTVKNAAKIDNRMVALDVGDNFIKTDKE